MGPPYKRGALWDLVDLFDIVIPSPRQRTGVWAGLDIVYVPAGPHAFFRSSGQFGPQQFILCWPAGPVAFRSVENACRAYQFFSVDDVCRRAVD